MAAEFSEMGDLQQSVEQNERRGSLRIVLERFREAMSGRRRSSSSRTAVNTTPFNSVSDEPIKPTATSTTDEDTLAKLSTSPEDTTHAPVDGSTGTSVDLLLVAEGNERVEADDTGEALLPMLSTRTGLNQDRAQKLFEKYGIKYEPTITTTENGSSNVIRRVEKPIRIRIHWTCHDCNSTFGVNKTCTNCGHRRCRECPRSPAKRVREILEAARQVSEQEDESLSASSSQQNEVHSQAAESSGSQDAAITSVGIRMDFNEHAELKAAEETDVTQGQYVIQQRPRSSMQLVHEPKAQITTRSCHECQAHFKPANRTECQSCGHSRCEMCPRDPQKRLKNTAKDENRRPEEINMVATVQRVYRKPRQRVRWTCDQCQALFRERERCSNCGHERCGHCTRDPIKRIPPTPDPAVLQSVAEKLANFRNPSPVSRQATAA